MVQESQRDGGGSGGCGKGSRFSMFFRKSRAGESKKSPNDVIEQGNQNNASNLPNNSVHQANNVRKISDSNPPEEVHGFQNEELHLQKLLSRGGKEDQFKAIGVAGITGVGKTTLCQSIFHKEATRSQFRPRIWVGMTGHPQKDDAVTRMLERLGVDVETCQKLGRRLDHVLRQQLIGKRFLIILDDLEDLEVWKHISDLLPKEYGGRLIVTGRNEKNITEMVEEENLYRLQPLTDQESCWLIYRDSVKAKDDELKSPARKVLEAELEKMKSENPEDEKWIEQKESVYRESVKFPDSRKLKADLEELQKGQNPKLIEEKRARQREQRLNAAELKRKCGGLPLAIKLLGEIKAVEECDRKNKLLEDIMKEIREEVNENQEKRRAAEAAEAAAGDEEPAAEEQDAETGDMEN